MTLEKDDEPAEGVGLSLSSLSLNEGFYVFLDNLDGE